jgi:hypothetical protein
MEQDDNGINFITVLFFIFLTLKLTGHIDWSWIWVMSPLWISLICLVVFGIIDEMNKGNKDD